MAKVDIDDHTDLAIEYGVRYTVTSHLFVCVMFNSWQTEVFSEFMFLQVSAVPTVIGVRGGDVIGQFVGLKDDDELDSFVSQIIGQ